MATKVQGYLRCPCGNTQCSPNQPGSDIPNGLEGIYFIVGQQQSPSRGPLVTTSAPMTPGSPPVASTRTSVLSSSSAAGPPPPPPPIIPGPPPPPVPPSDWDDEDDGGGLFNVGDAIKGFFKDGGKGKLRPASERKLGPVLKRKPRTGTTTTLTRQARLNSSNGPTSKSVDSTIQGPSAVEGRADSVSTVDSDAEHVELITKALNIRLPAVQDSDDEDSGDENNEWNDD